MTTSGQYTNGSMAGLFDKPFAGNASGAGAFALPSDRPGGGGVRKTRRTSEEATSFPHSRAKVRVEQVGAEAMVGNAGNGPRNRKASGPAGSRRDPVTTVLIIMSGLLAAWLLFDFAYKLGDHKEFKVDCLIRGTELPSVWRGNKC